MPSTTDIIQRNIQKQLALNSGTFDIASQNGAYQFIDSATGQPLSGTNDAGNYALSQAPAIYQNSLRAEVYNYAKSLFGGKEVPTELVEVLATMATYYSVQSGQPIEKLFNKGVLLEEFMTTINELRNRTSQIGYAGLNLTPNWANNVVIRPSIARAIEPWDAIGNTSDRKKYDNEPINFTFYATDTKIVYIRNQSTSGSWTIYTPDTPLWPT